jgi:hypothetical protein
MLTSKDSDLRRMCSSRRVGNGSLHVGSGEFVLRNKAGFMVMVNGIDRAILIESPNTSA